jgi:hypothetical protein
MEGSQQGSPLMAARKGPEDPKPAKEGEPSSQPAERAPTEKAAAKQGAQEKQEHPKDSGVGKSEGGGQKSKGDIDLFWLETVFPKPEDVFAYKSPTQAELAKQAVFGLDANVLLAPFQLGPESIANLEAIYKMIASENRLFAPAQAVREYGKNRARKIADVYGQVHTRLSNLPSVSSLDCPMLEGIAEYEALKGLGDRLKEKTKEYKAALTQLQQILTDWGWNDKVSELYRAVFPAGRIVHHDLSKEEIKADLHRRYTHKLPPGYKDSGKLDEGVGDIIMWHSLIKLGKAAKRPVIFVCNEEKADWFVRNNKEPILPRPELTHEFFLATGVHFSMMNWPRFLQAMDATPDTVREAELAWMSAITSHPPGEGRLNRILGVIDSIIRDFTGSYQTESEAVSWGGPDYITNERLEPLIRMFHSWLSGDEVGSIPQVGIRYLQEIDALLGAILDDNKTLEFITVADKGGGDEVKRRLIQRCIHFVKLWRQYQEIGRSAGGARPS